MRSFIPATAGSVFGRIRGGITGRQGQVRSRSGTPILPVSSSVDQSSPSQLSPNCAAVSTVAATLLIPPWISRAAVYLSRLKNTSASDADADTASSFREVAEICTMSILQDWTVASFAIGTVLLPGLVALAINTRRRIPSKSSVSVVSLLAYVLFVAPIWLDLLSQLLTGMRIRADYIAMTTGNIRMFSSSLVSFYSNIFDGRVMIILSAMIWSCRKFVLAVHDVVQSSLRSKGSSSPNKSPNISPSSGSGPKRLSFSRVRRPALRWCARPLFLLLGLATLYTLFLVAVMVSLMVSRTSTSSALHSSNVVFLVGSEALGLSYLEPTSDGFLLPSSIDTVGAYEKGSRPSFIFPSERYVDRDTSGKYPFYRRTLGFKGPKAFHINSPPNGRKPNIVFLCMETWRHRDVGVLGGIERKLNRNRTATPNFDRLAERGILFDNFHANGVQTSRTLISTLFGTLPQFTTSAAIDSPSAPSLNMSSLPSILKSMGYKTRFASATGLDWQGWNKFLPAHGFDELFDLDRFEKSWHGLHEKEQKESGEFDKTDVERRLFSTEKYVEYNTTFQSDNYDEGDDFFSPVDDMYYQFGEDNFDTHSTNNPQRNSWGLADEDAFRVLAHEITELSSSNHPFFVDFYSISSHHPFQVPWSFRVPEWIEEEARDNEDYRKYLEILAYSDNALGSFFDQMEEQGIMNNTIFLVGGDHGFGFCEHKPCFDGMNIGNANAKIYDEVVRVPLMLIGGSGLIPKPSRGTVVHEAASQVDLLATVLDIIGCPSSGFPQHGVGRSLMRKLPEGKDTAVLQNTFNDMAMGLKVGDIKYMFEGSRMISVYNTSQDNETFPLYSHRMKKMNDPLVGAPNDVLQVRDKVAKLLQDTTRCFHTNAFMPPEVAGRMGAGRVWSSNGTMRAGDVQDLNFTAKRENDVNATITLS